MQVHHIVHSNPVHQRTAAGKMGFVFTTRCSMQKHSVLQWSALVPPPQKTFRIQKKTLTPSPQVVDEIP
jgi:hypothetical protein